jgi:co-chaperonin GroES (HSP10)
MKPLKDLVVIEMLPEEEKKMGGLFIQPPKWAKPTNMGKVVAKGPEVNSVAIDEIVLINPYAALETEEKSTKLIREKDILCVIDQKK